ncbi:hypothetical protein H6761_03865 [Candidatus Nomurabacteria bacterium]|nr:hypothetical protein [Candidatus Nomurabacteria bacterium]
MPNWLIIITAILGLLLIILNLLNYGYLEAKNLDQEQSARLHAHEGY